MFMFDINEKRSREYSYRELLREGTCELSKAAIVEAEADAWILFSGTTGINRTEYLINGSKQVEREQADIFWRKINRRINHEPVQYIEGHTAFMGFDFLVNENVLIPRFDTEVLVDKAFLAVKEKMSDMLEGSEIKLLDMCTGSGCIIESLYLLCKDSKPCKDKEISVRAYASDVSHEALEVAKKNAQRLNAKVTFFEGNLFENVSGKYDMIVSNPPYIRTDVINTLSSEVKDYEPMGALDGYEDGLFFYRKIIKLAKDYLNEDGYIFFEIGHDQGEDVCTLFTENGYKNVELIKDLAGLDRVVCAKLKSK